MVVVQLRAAAVETLRKNEKTGWNSVYHQNWWFSEFHQKPRWMLVYFFWRFFKNRNLCMAKLRVLVLLYFSYFTDNSILLCFCFLKIHLFLSIVFFVCSSLLLIIIIFWVQSYIICLICVFLTFYCRDFLWLLGPFFELNELKKRRKEEKHFLNGFACNNTCKCFFNFWSQLGNFLFWEIIMMFFVHIVVSNPKLFWSIWEGRGLAIHPVDGLKQGSGLLSSWVLGQSKPY